MKLKITFKKISSRTSSRTSTKTTPKTSTTKNTNKDVEKLWGKCKPVKNKIPNLYRQDVYGNTLYKPSYGKNTEMGFHVDHIKPKSKGGSDHIINKQLLQYRVNIQKGNSYVKKSRHSECNKI